MAKLNIIDFLNEQGQPLPNIADKLTPEQLQKLGQNVVQMTERDLGTMREWLERSEEAMKIAKQVAETKTFPWDGCANVKYPLIAGASVQFASRAYAEIIKDDEVVKGKVIGKDPTGEKGLRAQRVSKHMSYQLIEENEDWEPQTDQMLHILPVVGTCFKKSYFCPVQQQNVSELVQIGEGGLIFDNKNTKSLKKARRLTHEFPLCLNEIQERIAAGIYRDVDVTKFIPADADGDEQAPHCMQEQHRWDDFDGDGYQEPYIVTVHKGSGEVMRVVPRFDIDCIKYNGEKVVKIEPLTYFTKFGFLPDPEGGFLDIGFGQMLLVINEAIDTSLNQLLDAGTLANLQGGFVARGFRIKAQTFSISPGEWKQIDVPAGELKNSLFPVPFKEPSNVLFQLLGFLVEAGKGLANQTEVLQGERQANEPATTTLALIEQGLKVYNSIYKRFYRSLKSEFKKLFRLNKIYLDDVVYYNTTDEEGSIARVDYEDKNVDVIPVADPSASTEVQRMARAQALMQILNDPQANRDYILTQYVKSIGEDPTKAIIPKEQIPQGEDPKVLELKMKESIETTRLQLEELKIRSEVDLNETVKMLNIAKAEAAEAGNQFEQYLAQIQELHNATVQMYQGLQQIIQNGQETPKGGMETGEDEQGTVQGMEEPAGDAGVFQLPSGVQSEPSEPMQPETDSGGNAESNGMEGSAD